MEANLYDILKPEEGFIQLNNNNESSNDNGSGVIQNQTINYNLSDKLIKQYEERLKQKDEEIKFLKSLIEKKQY